MRIRMGIPLNVMPWTRPLVSFVSYYDPRQPVPTSNALTIDGLQGHAFMALNHHTH